MRSESAEGGRRGCSRGLVERFPIAVRLERRRLTFCHAISLDQILQEMTGYTWVEENSSLYISSRGLGS